MSDAPELMLEVVHDTRYDYAAPVSLAHHLAYLRPLQDEYQSLLNFMMQVQPAPGHSRESHDSLGNAVRHFSLATAHTRLAVRAQSQVCVRPRFAQLQAASSPPWDALAQSLRYVARAPYLPHVAYALPSPYVPREAVLRDYARAAFTPARPIAEAAMALMQQVHSDFVYESHSTAIDTPLSEVWARKRGVCQDFAHLTIGALRMLGLPARYVSGYLLTHAPEGGATMLGADASHAWLQVWCPGTPGVPDSGAHAGWLDLDPTNNLVPGTGHVRLALGRDFGDVTPLRGVIRGSGTHTLNVAVATRVLSPAAVMPEGELLN
jgi:transglutaminase-like putative cysteine protease